MRIVCPNCGAAYDVPDAVAVARRTVRCARCATEFQAQPEVLSTPPPVMATEPTPPDPVPVPEPIASQADRLLPEPVVAQRPSRNLRTAILASWALSLAILLAAAWALLTWRHPLMRAWPPATRLYATLGYAQ